MHDSGVDSRGVEWAKGHDDVAVFLEIRSVEGSLFLIRAEYGDLMIARFGVEADEKEAATFTVVEAVKCVITARDRVKKGSGDTVEGTEIDAEAPDEIIDVVNMFLVRFGCEKTFGKPGATKELADVAVMDQGVDVGLDDGSFVNTVTGLAAGNRWGSSGVNTKFKTEHGPGGTFRVKGVPVRLDDIEKLGFQFGVKVVGHFEVLVKKGLVLVGVPVYQVRAGRNVISGSGLAERATKLRSDIEIFIHIVVAEFVGNIRAGHLGSPYFGGRGDSVRGHGGSGRRGRGALVHTQGMIDKALDRDSLLSRSRVGNDAATEVRSVGIVNASKR